MRMASRLQAQIDHKCAKLKYGKTRSNRVDTTDLSSKAASATQTSEATSLSRTEKLASS